MVRDIFAMAMEGKGNETIAGILQARKVLIPMAYWREKGLPRGGKVSQTDPYKWCKSTVEKILRQQEYCGDIVNFKTYSKSFKNKARIPNPEENWAVFKNVHEPIIEREVWEQVQQRIGKTKRRPPKAENGPKHLLADYLYCADCGCKLWYHVNSINHIRFFQLLKLFQELPRHLPDPALRPGRLPGTGATAGIPSHGKAADER